MKRTWLVKVVSFNAVCVLAALLGASRAAQATPFTFEFDIPDWSSTSTAGLFGTSGILDITVDNGAANDLNQAYANSQITQLSLRAVGGTYTNTWTMADALFNSDPAASYVSTDSSGSGTLDLLATSGTSTAYQLANAAGIIQLGVLNPSGGYTTFIVEDGEDSAAYVPFADSGYTGFQQSGTVVSGGVTSVPEPGTLGLVGIALAGLALVLRRSSQPRTIALRKRA